MLTAVMVVLFFVAPVGWFLWELEKERRGLDRIATVMRRQRDECRAAGEPWVAGRAWPRKE